MDIQSITAGAIQGITELLPVSSSGHLILFSKISNMNLEISEIAVLHLGTVAAILISYWKKIIKNLNIKTLANIVISIIPAGIVGFFLEDWIDENLSRPWIISLSLIFWGVILIVLDQTKQNKTEISKIKPTQALTIGIGQILAFIPGTSRSGVTTVFGILAGIGKETAIDYSFIMGAPLIAVSGLYSMILSSGESVQSANIVIATVTSFVTGIASIFLLRKFASKNILTYCGMYRILLGAVILLAI
jgi:undecaprenyl-diphosphatase